jgi:hypothetical protein
MLRLTDFIIDCPDTMKLAAFYSEVTGRPIKEGSHENWAGIKFGEVRTPGRARGPPRPGRSARPAAAPALASITATTRP